MSLFTIHVPDDEPKHDPETWTVVCDRCGAEIPHNVQPLHVFHVKDLAYMIASGQESALQQRLKALEISRSLSRAVLVDMNDTKYEAPSKLEHVIGDHVCG
jgi:hypothetical protein